MLVIIPSYMDSNRYLIIICVKIYITSEDIKVVVSEHFIENVR